MVSVRYRRYRVARNSGIHTVQPNDWEVVVVAFRKVTNADEAEEYYRHELLWEKMSAWCPYEPAHHWDLMALRDSAECSTWSGGLYILVED